MKGERVFDGVTKYVLRVRGAGPGRPAGRLYFLHLVPPLVMDGAGHAVIVYYEVECANCHKWHEISKGVALSTEDLRNMLALAGT